jgi:hypothetical protein
MLVGQTVSLYKILGRLGGAPVRLESRPAGRPPDSLEGTVP